MLNFKSLQAIQSWDSPHPPSPKIIGNLSKKSGAWEPVFTAEEHEKLSLSKHMMNIQKKKQQEYASMWQKTHGKDQWFVGHPPFKVLKCPLSNSRHGKSKLCPMAGKFEHEWIHDNFLLKKFPLPKGLWGVLCSDSCCSFRGINFFSPYHHETRFVKGQPKFWLCLKLWWHDDITREAAMFGAMSRCGPWFWTYTTAHNDNAQPPNPWQPHLIVIKNHCFSPSKHHPKATGGLSATFHVKSNCLSINSINPVKSDLNNQLNWAVRFMSMCRSFRLDSEKQ